MSREPMDSVDIAEQHEQMARDIAIRETLGKLIPNEPQVVVVGDDGAPLIVCYDCLAPIPPARLAAHPHAIRCVGCQEKLERDEAQYL